MNMTNEEDEFWGIVVKYPSWSVSKSPDDPSKSRLKLKNVHKMDIVLDYEPDFIDKGTLKALRQKLNDASMDFWGF